MQLMRVRGAFSGAQTTYVTVRKSYRVDVPGNDFYTVRDASRWNKFAMMLQILQLAWILLRLRPNVVITTGAAPGYWAIRIGKLLGAKTCWIDSIANVESVSLSGQLAGPYSDLWLTQWAELEADAGPVFRGSVIDSQMAVCEE